MLVCPLVFCFFFALVPKVVPQIFIISLVYACLQVCARVCVCLCMRACVYILVSVSFLVCVWFPVFGMDLCWDCVYGLISS